MVKRKLIYSIFETAFLEGPTSARVFAKILENTPSELKGVIVAKMFRIPTDFFNFLEESPIELTEENFVSQMLRVAKLVDGETCLYIVNRVISVGATGMLVDHLVRYKSEDVKSVLNDCI